MAIKDFVTRHDQISKETAKAWQWLKKRPEYNTKGSGLEIRKDLIGEEESIRQLDGESIRQR